MNVFISVDMEGVAGVSHVKQAMRGEDDYPAARKLMIGETNGAIEGAFDGGATKVVVNDSHGDMYNLIPEEMDERAELIIGSPKTAGSMMQGLGDGFDVALFVGYHAGPGVEAAVLDHVYSGRNFYDVRINGASMTETELNALLAGTYGVPLGLVTGDDKICAHVEKTIPGVRTVVVKEAFGRHVAQSIHPRRARAAIREGAREAVAGAGELQPYRIDGPFALELDTRTSLVAELCALAPGVIRTGGRTVRFESADFREVFRCLVAWMYLAVDAP
ncbi:MAG TPA: M55 family metallopeptidase [Actinomycetota bacterium]|nr:M55 family metallopeptidase [Actinomycetota bacterium]